MDADKQAIAEVINLYQIALDTHGWDLFEDIFTADVTADYCRVLHWTGLASFVAGFAPMHEATAGHQHSLGMPHNRAPSRLHQRLQLRPAVEDPAWPHTLRIPLQMLDK